VRRRGKSKFLPLLCYNWGSGVRLHNSGGNKSSGMVKLQREGDPGRGRVVRSGSEHTQAGLTVEEVGGGGGGGEGGRKGETVPSFALLTGRSSVRSGVVFLAGGKGFLSGESTLNHSPRGRRTVDGGVGIDGEREGRACERAGSGKEDPRTSGAQTSRRGTEWRDFRSQNFRKKQAGRTIADSFE